MNNSWTVVPTGLVFLASSQFASATTWTDEQAFEAAAKFMEATDEYFHHSVETSYKAKTKTVNYGVTAKHHRLRNNGEKYRGKEVSVHIGKQLTTATYVEAGIGQNRVKETYGRQKKNTTSYYVKGAVQASKHVKIELEHGRDIAYENQNFVNNVGELLTEEKTKATVKVQANKRNRLEFSSTHGKLSDGNTSRRNKVGAYHAIKPDWPYVEVGVEANHVDYDKQDEGYWTPNNYRSVGVVGSASFPVTEKLDLSTSVVLSRSTDDDTDGYGNGRYLSIGANYKIAENTTISANAHHIKSIQDDSDWSENAIMFGLKHKF